MKKYLYAGWCKGLALVLLFWDLLIIPATLFSLYVYGEYQDYWLGNTRIYYDVVTLDVYRRFGWAIRWLAKDYEPILSVSVLLALVFFGYLVWSAGHRPDSEEITVRSIDRLWYGVLLWLIAVAWILVIGAMVLLAEARMYEHSTVLFLEGELLGAGAVYASGMLAVYSTLVRMKSRTFFKSTMLYWLYRKIRGRFLAYRRRWRQWRQMIRQNLPLVSRTAALFGCLILLELLFCVFWYNYTYGSMGFVVVVFFLLELVKAAILLSAAAQIAELSRGAKRIAEGDLGTPIDMGRMRWEFRQIGENLNRSAEGISMAVRERMKSEHFKTELITNVSHDIKTPLTSIINYVDLMKKEEITDPVLVEYMDVLERQSARLKKLIEDLMEVSKASTGSLHVEKKPCDVAVLFTQAVGEFEERAKAAGLEFVVSVPSTASDGERREKIEIMADGRHLWRVFDNLLVNICKYAMPGTRIYLDLVKTQAFVQMIFKNISRDPLNVSSEELLERFVRGDSSRNTEGNGLGLSIASSLTELMGGTMALEIDGDLFKVILTFSAI